MKLSSIIPTWFLLSLAIYITVDQVSATKETLRSIANKIQARIIDGTEAERGEFPFIVTWHRNKLKDMSNCAGSLVAPNIVLSAAHCANSNGPLRIGSFYQSLPEDSTIEYSGVPATFVEKIVHPDYVEGPELHDLAILVLDKDIDTTIYPPLDLNFDDAFPAAGDMLTVIGFGSQNPNGWDGGSQTLYEVDLPESTDRCAEEYKDDPIINITEELHICAGYLEGGKDSCSGDSGGPLIQKIDGVWKQIGVVSTGDGCGKPGKSGIYARVSSDEAWFKINICSRSHDPKPSFCDGFTFPPTTTPDPSSGPSASPSTIPTSSPTLVPSEATPEPSMNPTGHPSEQPSSTPSATATQPSASPSVCIGQECTDEIAPHMVGDGLTCATTNMTSNKCVNNNYWTKNQYCQLSCYRAGFGYPGDVCCNKEASPTPTATPSISPTQLVPTPFSNCEVCDDVGTPFMINVGSDCSTTSLTNTRCNRNGVWKENKFCQLSCYKKGNGYEGDVCCTNSWVESPSVAPTTTPSVTDTPVPTKASPTVVPNSSPASIAPSTSSTLVPTMTPTRLPTSSPSKELSGVSPSTLITRPSLSPSLTATPSSSPSISSTEASGSSPTNTPSSIVPVPFGACFSGRGEVETSIGFRRLDQLKLGDQILTATGHHEPIYSFGHRSTHTRAEFLQLLPSKLEISPLHMIFLQSGEAVPASIVKVGDILESGEIVTRINRVTRTGVYAPFTPSGTLVVNGVNVSSYISFSESSPNLVKIGPIKLSYHGVAHTFQFFHRAYCRFDGCKHEKYTKEGMSKWVEGGYQFVLWVNQKDSVSAPMVCNLFIIGVLLISSGFCWILFQQLPKMRVIRTGISCNKDVLSKKIK